MITAHDIADRALQLAESFMDRSRSEIAALAEGDMGALFEASQIIRTENSGPHSAEHLAFRVLTGTHEKLRAEAAPK
jgi:hypothetical protein